MKVLDSMTPETIQRWLRWHAGQPDLVGTLGALTAALRKGRE